MAKLVVTEFMTLDGVIQDPQWSLAYWNDEISQFKGAEADAAVAHLLGRVTYEGFASAWPQRTGSENDWINKRPKYVVSTTLETADWENSHIISSDVVNQIARLKQELDQVILVHGSGNLVQTLVKHDLVDEWHLLIYPVVRGGGQRLFDEGTTADLQLVEATPFSNGVVAMVYRPAPPAEAGATSE